MRVLWALVLLAAPLLAQEDGRLRELLGQLLDDEIGVRERAAAELAEYGKAAIPALERLKSSSDFELRARAAAVLKMIAENEVVGRHWRRGPRITLDFESAPLPDILRELARQARDKFKFDPALFPGRASVRVQKATFWDALEAVCRAAPPLTWTVEGEMIAFLPERRPPFPARRQDEFMTWIEGITYLCDFDFTGAPRATFTLSLASAWEAGISPTAVDQKITEILDENGASVKIPDRSLFYGTRLDAAPGRLRRDGVFVPLVQGAPTPRRFSLVKGSTTYYFPKTYEDVTIDVQSTPNPSAVRLGALSVNVRNFGYANEACVCDVDIRTPFAPGEAIFDRLPVDQISVVDEQGGIHPGHSTGRTQMMNGTMSTQHGIVKFPFPGSRTPVSVRLHLLKSTLEKRVPFEFRDIPLE